MGYEIIYGRQFVKTNKGIIPIALRGSNNCTMFHEGKEIRERDWGLIIYDDSMIEATEEQIMLNLNSRFGSKLTEDACIMRNSKWMTYGDMEKFFKQGIKYAKSIEELREYRPGISLGCQLQWWDTQGKYQSDNLVFCNTTPELSEWIRQAKEEKDRLLASEVKHVYICIGFPGIEPLHLEKITVTNSIKGPVLAKSKQQYIIEIAGKHSIVLSRNPADALVFDSKEAAFAELPSLFGPYTFASAKKKEDAMEKSFVLRVVGGNRNNLYINTLTRYGLSLAYRPENARKKFISEAAAMKWYEGVKDRFQNIKAVEVINMKEEK